MAKENRKMLRAGAINSARMRRIPRKITADWVALNFAKWGLPRPGDAAEIAAELRQGCCAAIRDQWRIRCARRKVKHHPDLANLRAAATALYKGVNCRKPGIAEARRDFFIAHGLPLGFETAQEFKFAIERQY